MASWRVHLISPSYSAKDPNKLFEYKELADDTGRIEEYVNAHLLEGPTTFQYFELGSDLGMSKDRVARIMKRQDGWGDHGITFHPPEKK